MVTTIIVTILIATITYLLVGATYITVVFRRDTAVLRAAMSAGAHVDNARTGSLLQQPEVELAIMLFVAILRWPSVMYTRVMDAHDHKNDVRHQHTLHQESS